MKRFWIVLPSMELIPRARDTVSKVVTFDLMLGQAFKIGNWYVHADRDDDNHLVQEFALPTMQFLATPSDPDCSLFKLVRDGVREFIDEVEPEVVCNFVLNGGDYPVFKPFTPSSWPQKLAVLALPVDFISIYGIKSGRLRGRRNQDFAHIRVGKHLVFWDQLIYDVENPKAFESSAILDPEVLENIKSLLGQNLDKLEKIATLPWQICDERLLVIAEGENIDLQSTVYVQVGFPG